MTLYILLYMLFTNFLPKIIFLCSKCHEIPIKSANCYLIVSIYVTFNCIDVEIKAIKKLDVVKK